MNSQGKFYCLFPLLVILIAGLLAYIIKGIIFLIEDYGVSNDCKGSNLWEYVLVSMILMTSNFSIKNESIYIITIALLIIGLINLSMCIWGSIELWYYSCDDLIETNLWKIGLASFILQIVIFLFCIAIPPLMVCYIYKKEKEEVKNSNPLNEKITNDV